MWAYEIFIPIAIVVGIGLVLGLVLAVAAIILHVPVDERVEAVTEGIYHIDIDQVFDMPAEDVAFDLSVPVDIPAVPAMPLPYVKAVPKMVFAPRADRKLFKKSVNY